ncbi:hypothetical protein EDB19DRAFT_201681 [Suillus lakei]|nr:hypothetical protein EDB19DRAFT_201681 [Suillus lakei]
MRCHGSRLCMSGSSAIFCLGGSITCLAVSVLPTTLAKGLTINGDGTRSQEETTLSDYGRLLDQKSKGVKDVQQKTTHVDHMLDHLLVVGSATFNWLL